MATIKSFSDLPQSKKLAEILPLESADMFYVAGKGEPIFIGNKMVACGDDDYDALGGPDVLCWSLAALIEVLPSIEGFKPVIDLDINLIRYEGNYRDELCFNGNNLIDACYEMIIKLHELNLL